MLCPKSPEGLHYNCTTVQNVRHSKKDWVINPPEKTRLLQKRGECKIASESIAVCPPVSA